MGRFSRSTDSPDILSLQTQLLLSARTRAGNHRVHLGVAQSLGASRLACADLGILGRTSWAHADLALPQLFRTKELLMEEVGHREYIECSLLRVCCGAIKLPPQQGCTLPRTGAHAVRHFKMWTMFRLCSRFCAW